MNAPEFVKRYADPARAHAAQTHLRWLARLRSDVRLPRLHPSGDPGQLVLERLDGRPAQPGDLPDIAAALGRLHGTAHARHLHAATLDQPFPTDGLTIPDFPTGRRHILHELGITVSGQPVALYKDTNIRNAIITADGPALVDFDDLTLAPFGYDLAKLIVSTSMTHGRQNIRLVEAALHAYNQHVQAALSPASSCTLTRLAGYAEVHDVLTRRYLHRNSYQHPWPDVRPWPHPTSPQG
jgi:hypothetical protein